MEFRNIAVERAGRVATVTVNRPDKLNALDAATITELNRAFEHLEADPEVRAVVLTGAGDKAFVAGADIGEIRACNPTRAHEFSLAGQRLMRRIERCDKPVLAAINGFALGGGLELAMACHLRLAADSARLGLPEITLGLMPGFGGTQRLTRLVGRGRALEMMMTGTPIDAATAREFGLVNAVVESGAVVESAGEIAARLAAAAPLALAGIIAAVDQAGDVPPDQALAYESARFALCCATDDMREGTGAFLEKRTPEFTGR
ncbi:MAG: enoyl-CoA hydratase-related protein [Wenzhouxiangellaceae bacterium]|nr:enoyl-CoA hydratase-related protein [Wenzhouxiangellaceae bacterium]